MPPLSRTVPYLLLVASVLIGSGSLVSGTAQEPSPGSSIRIDHPAYIQAGTCDQHGDPIAALAETSTGPDDPIRTDLDAAPVSSGMQIPAAVSVTDVRLMLEDLLAREVIVRVAESEADPETTIACGSIGGEPDEDGNLYLALTGTEGSNVAGVVWLQKDDEGTTVTLFLIPALPVPGSGLSNRR